ncbi:hypothetical protein [Novosphingobium taihuense]|uniref:Uncharacterized protein n=1 Tax=Novosphingobium taihuense TaxID=260085 RepID=A0A7W7AF30_9SPHN|nr:hypothetical protein [Novosphingobium taihuense]MBB4615865.1 hypothetical protein [Novosphingobium taihuense]TWH79123.1 hypothetical protein IQ25_04085 [Novosphingobium taihuense]
MRTFNYILLSTQAVACAFLLVVIGSLMADPVRNPEGGFMMALIGLPLAVVSALILGWIYAMRSALPDEHRERILLISTVFMLMTTLPFLAGLLSGV